VKIVKVVACGARESAVHRLGPTLTSKGDVTLMGDAFTESDTVRLAHEWRPDVLLLEPTSLNTNDVRILIRVKASSPSTKVLVFSTAFTEQLVLRALRHGASGCLRLGTSAHDVLSAVRAVHAGELWATRKLVSQAYAELLAAQEPAIETANERGAQLSPRQLEIASWMRRGMTNKEIGRRLGISDMTVKTHAQNIFHKLEISGRMHLFGLKAQQLAAPLAPGLPGIASMTISVLGKSPPRHSRRLDGDGPRAASVTSEDHPPEPAAA